MNEKGQVRGAGPGALRRGSSLAGLEDAEVVALWSVPASVRECFRFRFVRFAPLVWARLSRTKALSGTEQLPAVGNPPCPPKLRMSPEMQRCCKPFFRPLMSLARWH